MEKILLEVRRAEDLKKDARFTLSSQEEGILLRKDGSLHTLLAGEDLTGSIKTDAAFLRFRKEAVYSGFAGSGNEKKRGWAEFECQLLSPRRFVLRNKRDLMDGKTPEDIITQAMRQAAASGIEKAMEAKTKSLARRLAQKTAVQAAEHDLLDMGWQLRHWHWQALEG